MSQLETNTATIQNLIEKANSLPDAGSGGTGSVETCTVSFTNNSTAALLFGTTYIDNEYKHYKMYCEASAQTTIDDIVIGSIFHIVKDIGNPTYLNVFNNNNATLIDRTNGTYTFCIDDEAEIKLLNGVSGGSA